MICARNFGACISMRDEPLDTPIPEKFEESKHYLKKYNEAVSDLNHYCNASNEELASQYQTEMTKEKKYYTDKIEELENLSKSFSRLIDQANAWNPPSDDHSSLKDFMVNQLTESKNVDCNLSFYKERLTELFDTNYTVWLQNKIKEAEKDVAYYKKQISKDEDVYASRNLWIKQLRGSL